jgi:hypothetical protein
MYVTSETKLPVFTYCTVLSQHTSLVQIPSQSYRSVEFVTAFQYIYKSTPNMTPTQELKSKQALAILKGDD